MILDKKGKIGGKISIIDIAVILAVLIVIAGIGMRYSSKITNSVQSDAEFEYTIKIDGVRIYTVDALQKKGAITDKTSEKNMGEIIDVDVSPAMVESVTANGEIIYAERPGYYTCLVTVRAHGKESDENYILDDTTELSVGRSVDFFSKYIKTSGLIMSVKVL
ncbi:MAG: DUF4330 domain-containing protein [Firmicutes bacterium]|nr:DUF4330 domain-containing protein [Bacillota bacterium]